MYKYCSWTWWPPKKKKKRSTLGFPWVVLHNRGWTVLFKFFSAIAIKDNSNFIKDKDRGVQIEDCPLK